MTAESLSDLWEYQSTLTGLEDWRVPVALNIQIVISNAWPATIFDPVLLTFEGKKP